MRQPTNVGAIYRHNGGVSGNHVGATIKTAVLPAAQGGISA